MTAANYLTLFRILLVPFFFVSLAAYNEGNEASRWVAFGIFLTASVTDALDGMIARLMKQRSKLGEFLDPLADKMLLLTGFIAVLYVHALTFRPPLWIVVTIVFRDIVIVVGMITIYFLSGNLQVQPNFLGKLTTACQMVTLIVVLLQMPLAIPLSYLTAGLSILSGLVYTLRGLSKLNGAKV